MSGPMTKKDMDRFALEARDDFLDPHAPLRVLTREEMNEIIRPKSRTEVAIEENGKTCLSCGEWKPFAQFYATKSNGRHVADRQSWCKACVKANGSKAWRERDKQARGIKVNKWWKGNGR